MAIITMLVINGAGLVLLIANLVALVYNALFATVGITNHRVAAIVVQTDVRTAQAQQIVMDVFQDTIQTTVDAVNARQAVELALILQTVFRAYLIIF